WRPAQKAHCGHIDLCYDEGSCYTVPPVHGFSSRARHLAAYLRRSCQSLSESIEPCFACGWWARILRLPQKFFASEVNGMSTYPQFGELLNQQLTQMDRSPSWLARQLGISPSTVGRWLNDGARPASPEIVVRISDLLGIFSERERLMMAAGYGYANTPVE